MGEPIGIPLAMGSERAASAPTLGSCYRQLVNAPTLDDLLKLDLETRLEIVSQLWDSIVDAEPSLPVSADDQTELARRLEAHHRDPGGGAPWPEVRERIFRRG